MIAAITGGAGFVGKALVARLARVPEISEIRILSRREQGVGSGAIRWFRGDLTSDDAALREFLGGAQILFHCAGELRRVEAMQEVHVEGTRRLIDAAAGRVARWVQLSSVGAYGSRMREGVVDERSPVDPQGEYERTKTEADALVSRAAAHGEFTDVTLRPSIVFGPGMPNRSLGQLVSMVERGLFAFVGQEASIANYVYVDDVADALLLCGVSPSARGVYNLSDDRPLEGFVGAIAAALGRPAPARRLPEHPLRALARLLQIVPGSPLTESRIDALTRRVRYPAARIAAELGYAFEVSIEEGLRRFIGARRSNA